MYLMYKYICQIEKTKQDLPKPAVNHSNPPKPTIILHPLLYGCSDHRCRCRYKKNYLGVTHVTPY